MAAIGFVEVAATARVIQLGHPASAGTVLAVWAAGSVAGGLIYGSRDWPGRAARQLRVLLLLVAGGFAIVSRAGTWQWLYPLMFAAGLACAPAAAALTTSFSMAHHRCPGRELRMAGILKQPRRLRRLRGSRAAR